MTRVCVIEDDDGIREAMHLILEDEGYAVVEAADGLAGYALLRHSADRLVVLLDHRLPHLTGCDLLELVATDTRLRARHAFVSLTGNARAPHDECPDELARLGVGVLAKPFGIDELLKAVRDAERRLAMGSGDDAARDAERDEEPA